MEIKLLWSQHCQILTCFTKLMKKYYDRYYKTKYTFSKKLKHFKIPKKKWMRLLHKRLNSL